MGMERPPESWSRERSSDRDCLVSILYGRRSSAAGTTPRSLFQRTVSTGRTTQVTVSARSITTSGGRLERSTSSLDVRKGGSR